MPFQVKCFAILWLICFASQAQETPPHVRFYSEIATPYFWLDEYGQPQGVNVDIAHAMASRLPFETSVEQLPWARAFNETLTKSNTVLLSLLRTSKREDQFQWLGMVHQVKASLVGLVQEQRLSVDSLERARQFRVGTIRGYGSADYLLEKGFVEGRNLILVSNTTRLWQMLYEGRVDLVVSSLTTDRYEIENINLDPRLIEEKLELPDLNVELQVATGNRTSSDVVSAIQAVFAKMEANGELADILTKWGIE